MKKIKLIVSERWQRVLDTPPRSRERRRAIGELISFMHPLGFAILATVTLYDPGAFVRIVTTVQGVSLLSAGALASALVFETLIRHSKIKSAPGTRTNFVLKFLLTKKLHERVFEPIVADMQYEYNEALLRQDHREARWVWIRGVGILMVAAVAQLPVSLIGLIIKLWKAAN